MSRNPKPTGPRSAKRRLYRFAFVDEIGPLLAVHTLWFANHGVAAAQVSIVFALWPALVIVLEVPSGALADRVDRRHFLAGY